MSVKKSTFLSRYHTNPFFILGLSASVSQSELSKRLNEAKIYAKNNMDFVFDGRASFLGQVERDQDSIKLAVQLLENPKKRIIEEIFWFWTTDSLNTQAFQNLVNDQEREAVRLWQSDKDSIISRHNLNVYRHGILICREILKDDLDDQHWDDLRYVLIEWMNLYSDKRFWGSVQQRIESIYKSNALQLLENTKKQVLIETLQTNKKFLSYYLDVNNLKRVAKQGQLLVDCNIPKVYLKDIINDVLEPILLDAKRNLHRVDEIYKNQIAKCKDPQEIIWGCDAVLKTIKAGLREQLDKIRVTDVYGVSDAIFVFNEYSELLNIMAVKLFDDAKAYGKAKKILIESEKYAVSEVQKQRVAKNLTHFSGLSLDEEEADDTEQDKEQNKQDKNVDSIQKQNDKPLDTTPSSNANNKKTDEKKESPNLNKVYADFFRKLFDGVQKYFKTPRVSYREVSKLVYRVRIQGGRASAPSKCNCCLGYFEGRETVSASFKEWNTTHTRSFDFPICNKCRSHRNDLFVKQWSLVAFCVIGSWIFSGTVFRLVPSISFWNLFFSSSVASFIILYLGNVFFPFKGAGDSHGSCAGSVKMVRADKSGTAIFEFSNRDYANQFAIANGSTVEARPKWKHARGGQFPLFSKTTSKVLSIALGGLFIISYFQWDTDHAILYVDNASNGPVYLTIKGKAIKQQENFTIPHGVKKVGSFPVGSYEIFYKGKKLFDNVPGFEDYEADLDEFEENIQITSGGKWIWNLDQRNSYKLKTVSYGSASRIPVQDLGNPKFFKTDADYIFEKPPHSISTKSGGTTRTVLIHSEDDLLPSEIANMKKSVDQHEFELNQLASEIQTLKSRIEINSNRIHELESMGSELPEYLLNEYNGLIATTNNQVEEHNQQIHEYERKREEYNREINNYNSRIQRANDN